MVRPQRTSSPVAAAALCSAVAIWAVGASFLVGNFDVAQTENFGTRYGDLVLSVAMLSFALVGFFVVRRLPSNPVGWMLLVAGLAVEVFGAADEYWVTAARAGSHLVGGNIAGGFSVVGGVVFAGLVFVGIPLVFPDGVPLSGTWLKIGGATAVLILVVLVVPQVVPLAVVAAIITAASLVVRYRRGDDLARQQLRWLGGSTLLVICTFVALGVVGHFLSRPTPMWFRAANDASSILIIAIPLSIGIAVLKYRLWAIDVFADRGVVLIGVTAFVTAVYVAVVIGIGAAVGSRDNIWLLIGATVIVAMTVQPIRRRVELSADRLVYGQRSDPYGILTEFSRQIADTYLGADALESCAHAAAVATRADHAHAWIMVGEAWQHSACWPPNGSTPEFPGLGGPATVSVEHHGTVLGAISVDKDSELSPHETRLLNDLAAQAAMLFRNVVLNADLRLRLAELSEQAQQLRLSRQRILDAEDSARQRIERDLHDGAQQRLVTLGTTLQRLRTRMVDDPRLLDMLDGASAELRSALGELRELARGIHPSLLVEAGLPDALSALVERSAVSATISHVPKRRYSAPIESTVYYVVSEALTNVAKHAPSASAEVTIAEADHQLVVRICDNGAGGADHDKGTGLRGLEDRVSSIGGTLTITDGTGTKIIAELPCD